MDLLQVKSIQTLGLFRRSLSLILNLTIILIYKVVCHIVYLQRKVKLS